MTTPHPAPAGPPLLAVDLVTTPALLGPVQSLARGLEAAGIGALTLSDGGLHPVHIAASLAPATSAIALIPRTDAVYVEPFHLATQLMSLDHVSAGRAGWLVEARTDEATAVAVGRELLDADATQREVADVIAAQRLVWDSWTDDAVVRDTTRGVYIDATRLQYADFEGATFSVRGPSITPRSPQGLVPVLVADEDREVVGDEATALADGRVLDVHVAGGAEAGEIAAAVRAVIGSPEGVAHGAPDATTSGPTPSASASPNSAPAPAPAPTPALVRLIGLDPAAADLAARVSAAASALREEGLIAPAPSAGDTLRDQLGLARPDVVIDPSRRSDRARRAEVA